MNEVRNTEFYVGEVEKVIPKLYEEGLKADVVFAEEFTFESNFAETLDVKLVPGTNEFNVPCFYSKLGRNGTTLSLTRKSDGKVFKRSYPVLVEYEPIKLRFALPEYRCNFYPGQDYTKITGTAISAAHRHQPWLQTL